MVYAQGCSYLQIYRNQVIDYDKDIKVAMPYSMQSEKEKLAKTNFRSKLFADGILVIREILWNLQLPCQIWI